LEESIEILLFGLVKNNKIN